MKKWRRTIYGILMMKIVNKTESWESKREIQIIDHLAAKTKLMKTRSQTL